MPSCCANLISWTRLGGLTCLLAAAGCSSGITPPPAPAPTPTPARLLVVNQTNYEWHLVIASTAGPERVESTVLPRDTVRIALAGGDYLIGQSTTAGRAAAGLAREIPAHLAAGQTYRWRLDTLLSDTTGDPPPPSP